MMADLAMGAGVAKAVMERYLDAAKLADLKRQDAAVGQLAVARIAHRRYILLVPALLLIATYAYHSNLVTKNKFHEKPKYADLRTCLNALKTRCTALGITELAMPQIGRMIAFLESLTCVCVGCGMDKLDWGEVKQMLREIFSDGSIAITIYSLSPNANTSHKNVSTAPKPQVVHL